ncbi:hypothetical protein GGF46_001941 [Coemansia sp. RSA 552]|nr:hypothetical protein GGF46_001941 [Coemansia sp. RSA 552]
MGAERALHQGSKERGSGRNRMASKGGAGKVSIGNLVEEGLLAAGNVVVCNSWPFSAVVTKEGTFAADWTVPEGLNALVGREFMRREFETPSAWATAVCRVMRAQRSDPLTESRVAVNGWTACRVRVCEGEPNHGAVGRLAEMGGSVEVCLDTLRRELVSRANRAGRGVPRGKRAEPKQSPPSIEIPGRNSGSEGEDAKTPLTAIELWSTQELQEITGAVDGLARRVESDLALGCVKQRKAAAVAATAISQAMTLPVGAKSTENAWVSRRYSSGSRKRKSIPDMARHSKHSRVPTAEGSEASSPSEETESDDDDRRQQRLDDATRARLAFYRERAESLKRRSQMELKSLRYQRRQRLKRRIQAALDSWLARRRQLHSDPQPGGSPAVSPTCCGSSSSTTIGAFPQQQQLVADLDLLGTVRIPGEFAGQLPRLCAACGSGGARLVACGGCGDTYHSFCCDGADSGRFVCRGCRVCARCLDSESAGALRQCGECRVYTHTSCSRQRGAEAGSGRWVCDDCVRCFECGTTMADSDEGEEWMFDFTMCSPCARQVTKARVCPVCIATYTDVSLVSNSSMVCCDVCALWIHTKCDRRLTAPVYEALITVEDAPYLCPHCTSKDGADSDSDDEETLAGLPCCLRALPMASDSRVAAVAADAGDTEEAANLLLSLTRTDIRFDRFSVDALETRFCVHGDWRQCELCALHGDGSQGEVAGLGRLVPLRSSGVDRWVHVECLAWAWGPRPVVGGASGAVTFEGLVLDPLEAPLACSLCSRPRASFHCCAPVYCDNTAYHLPCLLLSGTPAPDLGHEREQYCAAWRRALCATHAPLFSSVMPGGGQIESPSYDCVRVDARTDSSVDPPKAGNVVLVGSGLVVLQWGSSGHDRMGPGFRCVRFFGVDNVRYSLGVSVGDDLAWRGWLTLGVVTEAECALEADSLHVLLRQLFARGLPSPQDPLASVFVASAPKDPLRFLGLSRSRQ